VEVGVVLPLELERLLGCLEEREYEPSPIS
jgi:hypothetical protein